MAERWTIYVDPNYNRMVVRQPGPKEAERFGFEPVEVIPAATAERLAEALRRAAGQLRAASERMDEEGMQVQASNLHRAHGDAVAALAEFEESRP